MAYLLTPEYAAFGLCADTAGAWVTAASTMIDAHCRRPTLLQASYLERLRMSPRGWSVRLTYGPLVSVDAVRAKYAPKRVDDYACGPSELAQELAQVFGLPGSWVDVDVNTFDVCAALGEVRFVQGALMPRYSEVEVSYTAGVATLPDAVKVACAQIVRNAQATPGLNVSANKMNGLQMEYFSDSLLDAQVRALLRPYVAEKLA